MFIGGWKKFFTDYSYEDGNDLAVQKGLASWSKGRLEGITQVELTESNLKATLSIPDTEWHQFDRFFAYGGVGKLTPQRTFRAVQALLRPQHEGYFISFKRDRDKSGAQNILYTLTDHNSQSYEHSIQIPDHMVGSWATLVVFPMDSPKFCFSAKGKVPQ